MAPVHALQAPAGTLGLALDLPGSSPLGIAEEATPRGEAEDCSLPSAAHITAGPLQPVGGAASAPAVELSDPGQIAYASQAAVLADGTEVVLPTVRTRHMSALALVTGRIDDPLAPTPQHGE